MKIIGITGNIGSGKSTIANLLDNKKIKIIDLDKLGHKLLDDKKYIKKVVDIFGETVLEPNGKLGRKKLGKIVFSNPDMLDRLNQIIHSDLKKKLIEQISMYKKSNYESIIIDAALIFEMGLDDICDKIILISTNKWLSYLRVHKQRGISLYDFLNRYKSQLPVKVKKKLADVVIYNNLPLKFIKKKLIRKLSNILFT